MKAAQILLSAALVGAFVSCTPTQQYYGGGGALAGAATGAILGDDTDDVIRGAAIGGAAGVGIGAYQDSQNQQQPAPYQAGGTYQAPPPPTPAKPKVDPNSYPMAIKTPDPKVVLSPYKPYNKVRVTNFTSGQLAKDPDNGRIFRVP